jgi:hypothetical protein
VAKRKEKEDRVMKCGKEKGKGRLGDEVWQRERKGTSSLSLPFAFFLSHFSTQSSFSFLFATLHHPVFLSLTFCHFITKSFFFFLFATERLGDKLWQRERIRETW